MSRINNLQPKAVDSSSLPISATKTANANPTNKQANAAINHLSAGIAAMQKARPQQDDLKQSVTIDFGKDFKGKTKITQADLRQVYYEKLADRAKLSEESKQEFVTEMSQNANNPFIDTDKTNYDDKEINADLSAKRQIGINVNDQTVTRLREYHVKDIETAKQNDQKADDLIAKYTDKSVWFESDENSEWFNGKREYPLDESGLGKELSTQNADVINKVLGKLSPADAKQVSTEMLKNASDEQLVSLAKTDKGRTALDNLKINVPDQTERINKAKEAAAKTDENKTIESPFYTIDDGIVLSADAKEKLDAIGEEYFKKTGKKFNVNSGTRSPYTQADAMYTVIESGDPKLSLYGNRVAINEILNAYNSGKKQGKSKVEIVKAMTDEIQKQVDNKIFISNHLKAGAIDIDINGEGNIPPMTRTEKKIMLEIAKKVTGGDAFEEKHPPHIHIQY
jgi:hypothetical protein